MSIIGTDGITGAVLPNIFAATAVAAATICIFLLSSLCDMTSGNVLELSCGLVIGCIFSAVKFSLFLLYSSAICGSSFTLEIYSNDSFKSFQYFSINLINSLFSDSLLSILSAF